jgi:hypothetical protein
MLEVPPIVPMTTAERKEIAIAVTAYCLVWAGMVGGFMYVDKLERDRAKKPRER